jgi:hypothetical protein
VTHVPVPRRRRLADDTGSLPMALLLSLVAMSLSALLTPMVLGQVGATRLDARRVHALHAAQSGLDIALGQIRAADDGAGNGQLNKLPCGPFTGKVGGGTARYRVTIDYFAINPQGRDDAWIALNRMKCESTGTLTATPTYALFRAQGTDSATGGWTSVPSRWLRGTYTFRTTNENIAGGLIHVYKTPSSTDLCMDGGSGAPAAGTNLQMRPCNPGAINQMFAYNANLTIVLVTSKTPAMPLGMCLDAGNPANNGNVVQFQPCGPATKIQQQWSINDSANLEGAVNTAGGLALSGRCFNVQSPNVPGSLVVLGACGGAYNNIRTFSAEAPVGAGAAGKSSGQVVNFSQFGRCIDVTEFNVNYGYLIVWPCKQAPDPSKVGWNQKWTTPAVDPTTGAGTGQITTTNTSTGVKYCLRSPGSTVPGMYVTVIPCPGITTPEVTWTVSEKTDSYATSYTAVDYRGKCLSPTDPTETPPDFYPKGLEISKIVVADCDGSTLQKWNAPANILQPLPLRDITEK